MRILQRLARENAAQFRVWLVLIGIVIATPVCAFVLPLLEKQLIDGVVIAHKVSELPRIVVTYAALWLGSLVLSNAGIVLRALVGERMSIRMREKLLAQSTRLSVAFSHIDHTGRSIALFANDIPTISTLFSGTILDGIAALIALAFGGALMVALSPQLAIVAIAGPPLVVGSAMLIMRPMRRVARQAQDKLAELIQDLQDNLSGLREVIAFGREAMQAAKFSTGLEQLLHVRMQLAWMDAGVQSGQSALALVATLIILGYGGYLAAYGHTTLGSVIAMRSLFTMILGPSGQLFGMVSAVQRALGSADRVYAYLDQQPRVVESDDPVEPDEVRGAVTFGSVTFSYLPGRPVLHDVSFSAAPGEVVALVGPSGAGKSTLMSLLVRFYDPDSGRVLVDGIDLRDLSLGALRDNLAVVFQDAFLFATTVRENIAFGWDGATEDEIVDAAKLAQAWEFIERLPDGLDTLVGERGVRLSEGQKQRLAIARALLRDPRILILDEPTAALDARSEKLLQTALDTATAGRTTFVIAHRLATVQRAHRILVLDGGRIVERGTHAELLRVHGLYRELFELQFGRTAAAEAALANTSEQGRMQLRPLASHRQV